MNDVGKGGGGGGGSVSEKTLKAEITFNMCQYNYQSLFA